MGYVFLIIISLTANADILSDIFNYNQNYDTEYQDEPIQDDCEPEHYSWNELYLNEYPEGVEVIVDPYID